MNVEQTLSGVQDVMTVKRVYGEPYEHNGLTIIPAAAVRGGGGGGADEAGQGGAGFGLQASPKGAWVIEGGQVTWKPAIDVNRIVLGGQVVAFAATVALAAVVAVREIVQLRARRSMLHRRLTIHRGRRHLRDRMAHMAHIH